MMNEMKMADIPQMSVGQAVNLLADLYTKALNRNLQLKNLPSVMLWGAPGVGKSQAVQQIAEKIRQTTKKEVNVRDVRLLMFNPIDLRGIPTANIDKTLAIWLKPQIFQMDESENVLNILFLDEISAAPPSVQAAAYQITLDRVVGEHKLPDNCLVLAAGNRMTDRSVAYKMPKALANRLCHIEITAEFTAWKKWALEARINEKIIGFISFRQDYLLYDVSKSDNLAYPTPRSWEMASKVLNMADGNIDEVYSLIAGLVGMGAAAEFRTWENIYQILPSMEDIFSGKMPPIPQKIDALYALVSEMAAYAKAHKDDLKAIANSIRYAELLPADFSVVLLKDYLNIEKDYRSILLNMPEFRHWLENRGRFLNGII